MTKAQEYIKKEEVDPLLVVALTVFMEAADQSLTGKFAVVSVINNRVKKKFKDYEVDFQKLSYICLEPYQFSCWNDSNQEKWKRMIKKYSNPDNMAFIDCLFSLFFQFSSFFDNKFNMITPNRDICFKSDFFKVTHYYNPKLADPYWAKDEKWKESFRIEDHVFGYFV